MNRFVWQADEFDIEEAGDEEAHAGMDEGRHSWNSGDHPRDGDGQFAHGGGGAGHHDAPTGAGRGMPDTLASANVTLSRGGNATLSRHADGNYSLGNGSEGKPLNPEQTQNLLNALAVSDDWDPGDTEALPGIGKITRDRGGSTLELDDGPTLTLSSRDVTRMQVGKEQVDQASRVDTGNGDLDVFPDGKKVGFRHLGDDGAPVEVLFNRSSATRISRAIDAFIDDWDDPDTPNKAVHTKTVNTNVGKVQVTMHGDWTSQNPGDRLTILPVDGDDWGMVVDGPRQRDWARAVSDIIDETATREPEPGTQPLTEASASLAEIQQTQPTKGRFKVLLIRAGWGSSGYYSEAVLKRDGPTIWPEGTHMYLNHQTPTESAERPEGDVHNWASILTSTPVWDPVERGLVAEVQVFPQWRGLLNDEFAAKVGLSIRASGRVEYGEAEGREGPLIASLDEGISVDWVTQAGAGGRVLELIESARAEGEHLRIAAEALAPPFKKKGAKDDKPATAADKAADDAEDAADGGDDEDEENADGTKKDDKLPAFLKKKIKAKTSEARVSEARNVGHWMESRLHRAFTEMADDMFGEGRLSRDERIGLSSAIGEGLNAFNTKVADQLPHLYERDIWDMPEPAQAATADNNTKGAPVSGSTEKQTAPDRAAVTESAREKDLAVKLAEANDATATAQRELAEARKATADELAALKTRLDESDAEKLRLRNDKTARAAVAEALKTSGLPEATHSNVTESACRDLPLTETGILDAVKLGEAIDAAIAGKKTEIASVLEAAGVGQVRGLGESRRDVAEADVDKELDEILGRLAGNAAN